MGFKVIDGMSFHYAVIAADAVWKEIATLTNAAPPVAGLIGHGYNDGDELLVSSPWELITDTIVRVANKANDSFALGGLDTTDKNLFAQNGGNGTKVIKIAGWKEIPQVESYDPQGGDPVFKTRKLLKRKNSTTFPTGGFDAVKVGLKCAWDAPLFTDVMAVSRAKRAVCYRQTEPDGSVSYGFGYLIFKENRENDDGVLVVNGSFSSLGLTTSY